MNEKKANLTSNLDHEDHKDRRRKKLIKRIILALLLLLLLAIGLQTMGFIRFPWESEQMIIGNVKQGNLLGLTDEELLAELQRQADESNVIIQLNSKPVFETGSSEGSLYLGNPTLNCFNMQVQIKLDDTGELVYDSGVIPPGYYIDYDRLLKVLEKGTHRATATITYSEETVIQTTTQFKIEIVVKG